MAHWKLKLPGEVPPCIFMVCVHVMGMRFMSLTLKYSEPIIYLIFMLNYL